VRVELKTDVLNEPSRRAMLRIGAREEGVLRKHTLMWTGRYRDTIYYSVLDTEWAEVKARLEGMIARS
jgi:RimJ/RimL family protein N-acetyltransferase